MLMQGQGQGQGQVAKVKAGAEAEAGENQREVSRGSTAERLAQTLIRSLSSLLLQGQRQQRRERGEKGEIRA